MIRGQNWDSHPLCLQMSLECRGEPGPKVNTQDISSPQVLTHSALEVGLECWGA